ncbi:MAG TPA: UDP-N-acetylmuramate dehydrogenase [Firmicutes bacterium]|nr:UDP-N-acetylmuramate dehydrogenase [Bacillota bacterium]
MAGGEGVCGPAGGVQVNVEPEQVFSALRTVLKGEVRIREPMRNHTSFRIGGPADIFIVPYNLDDLRVAVSWLREHHIDFIVIGNGTNLLVSDNGIRGAVIKLGGTLNEIEIGEEGQDGRERGRCASIMAGAGALLPHVARRAAEHGLAGLEFAGGIPGSVGGATVMNAGAYGCSMQDVVAGVLILREDGTLMNLDAANLGFRNRGTKLLDDGTSIVISVRLCLVKEDRDQIIERTERLLAERASKQPLSSPSAGCVFKNPSGGGAGRYIDAAGLKGLRIGDAQVSPKHANFIINLGNAKASDVMALMEEVRLRVFERFGVVLEPEIRVIGG